MTGDENTNTSDSRLKLSYMEVIIRMTIEAKVGSKVFLVNGIKLEGRAIGVDDKSLLYQKANEPMFAVNLAAIASFLPNSEVVPQGTNFS